MSLDRIPEMRAMYGREVIFLVGGGLRSHSEDLVGNCSYFRELATQVQVPACWVHVLGVVRGIVYAGLWLSLFLIIFLP